MHENEIRSVGHQGFEAVAHRLLPRCTASREGQAHDAVQCSLGFRASVGGGDDLEEPDFGKRKRHGAAAEH
jgi:hypothetical protein